MEAEKLANRAERLHGPYGLMDMGDRPQKLLAEIEATRARNHIPRVSASQVAAKDVPSSTNQQTTMPAPTTYGGQQAMPKAPVPTGQQMAGQSTSPYSSQNSPSQNMPASSSTPYSGMASSQQGMPAATSTPYGGMAATGSINRQTPVVPSWPSQANVGVNVNLTAPALSLAADEAKKKAQACLVEARRLQREGHLLEARQKALEAQRMRVVYGKNDDQPEFVLAAVNSLCQRKVDALMQQADQYMKAGQSDARSFQLAEQQLSQAKELALGFSMDCYMIDMKAAQVKQAQGNGRMAPTIPSQFGNVAATPVQNHDQGHELLAKARMELRAGQTANARRLANEAFSPNLGVQNEAAHLLQEIDTEEFNQKVLVAKRTFDAAVSAYNRQEYAQAKAMFRTIDAHLLPPDRQARLNDYMRNDGPPAVVAQTSRWQDGQQSGTRPVMPTLPSNPQAVVPSFPRTPPVMSSMQTSRPAMSNDQPPSADLIAQTKAMQEVKFQKLRNEGMAVMAESRKRFDNGETVKAIEMLKEHIRLVEASGFDTDKITLLKKQPEARLQMLVALQHTQDFNTAQNSDRNAFMAKKTHEFLAEEAKKKQIAELMNQYHSLYKEHKFREAEICAIKAKELDPDNYVLGAAVQEAHMAMAHQEYHEIEKDKEDYFRRQLNDSEKPGPVVNVDNPVSIDARINGYARMRNKSETVLLNGARSEKEREIIRKLDGQATAFEFRDTPLQQVLDDLANWSQINIVQDGPALKDANISTAQPITMKLEGASLKAALNNLLHQAHLTYQVKDDALIITTEENARGKLERRVFPVLDLVIPVVNYASGGAAAALQQATGSSGQQVDNSNLKINGQTTPWLGLNSMSTGTPVSNGTITGGVQNANSMTSVPASQMQNSKDTIEDVLIKLIQNTIEPQSWSTVGGPGTIEFYPLGKALVVNQTPDIQEQVQELLNALRRLQDMEVAVEVKFITIAEAFYERIGLDFNINITNNNSKYSQQINSQQFAPFGFLNNFNPKNLVSGLTPAGNLTQDLGIPINTSSFQMAVPPFGQYPNIPGGNGGVDLGIAFLSDIQVFMFMEAAQGDQPHQRHAGSEADAVQRSNLHHHDSGLAVLRDQRLGGPDRWTGDLRADQYPGTDRWRHDDDSSGDLRRPAYVRLSLTPNLTNLASANITLFPITTFITPVFEGGAVGQPVPFTQFLQQPTFNSISVNTTVNVPDGGTVLLGGLKRLSEGRNEFGPPILSNIPYLDRLFKNVGYGRETTSLLMMVTPRIIINEEEESRQVPGALQSAQTQQP